MPYIIYGRPYRTWQTIFDTCYRWRWINEKTGYYNLIGLPGSGGIMKQYNAVLDILNIIELESKSIILK